MTSNKALLRREMRSLRNGITADECDCASAKIRAHLQAWVEESNFSLRRVALYLAAPREPDLDDFARTLQAQGISIYAPNERDAQNPFCEIAPDWSNVHANAQGLREPLEYSLCECLTASEMDLILLPGLAFDATGARLGQGGGWYDRALQDLPKGVLCAGVCFDFQVVEFVPCEAHDRSVSIIVTDKRILHAPTFR